MDKLDILLWAVSGGFTILFSLMMVMWNSTNKKFEKIDEKFEKIDEKFEKLDKRFEKLEHDMIEVKTILRMQECCMIKDDRRLNKAE